MERLFDRQTLIIVEGFGVLGGGGRHTEVVASARTYRDFAVSPASFNTAANGTPVHSLALSIIPSGVRERVWGPHP